VGLHGPTQLGDEPLAPLESIWVSVKDVAPCTAVARTTASTSGPSRSCRWWRMMSFDQELGEAGKTNPERRLTTINTKPTAAGGAGTDQLRDQWPERPQSVGRRRPRFDGVPASIGICLKCIGGPQSPDKEPAWHCDPPAPDRPALPPCQSGVGCAVTPR